MSPPTAPPEEAAVRWYSGLRRVRMGEWGFLLRSVGLLGGLLVLERTAPVPRLVRFFAAAPGGTPPPPDRLPVLLDGLLRRLFRKDYCMKRSLLLFYWLRRGGYAPHVCMGIARQHERLRGHAWVELDGRPFAEAEDPASRFRVTYRYPKP